MSTTIVTGILVLVGFIFYLAYKHGETLHKAELTVKNKKRKHKKKTSRKVSKR